MGVWWQDDVVLKSQNRHTCSGPVSLFRTSNLTLKVRKGLVLWVLKGGVLKGC